jgi:hypothetical protein
MIHRRGGFQTLPNRFRETLWGRELGAHPLGSAGRASSRHGQSRSIWFHLVLHSRGNMAATPTPLLRTPTFGGTNDIREMMSDDAVADSLGVKNGTLYSMVIKRRLHHVRLGDQTIPRIPSVSFGFFCVRPAMLRVCPSAFDTSQSRIVAWVGCAASLANRLSWPRPWEPTATVAPSGGGAIDDIGKGNFARSAGVDKWSSARATQ